MVEMKLKIDYSNLLDLINQLPNHLKEKLKADLIDTPTQPVKNAKENLAELIKEMRTKPMFTEIEDPVKWQKNLRNEWQ